MRRALFALLLLAAGAEAAPDRWLRRAYLDLVGAPPPVDEVAAYLARPDEAARRAVAERLAESTECAERWARILAEPLAPAEDEGGGAKKLEEALARALADGTSWPDTLASLVAPGPAATAFARPLDDDGTRIAAKIGSGMLGVRLRCARCHDDVTHGWTAAEYFGLAAFYGRPRTIQAPARLVAAHRAGRIRTLYDLVMHLPTMKPRGTDHRWVRANVLHARALLSQLHGMGVGPMPPNVERLDWAAYDVYRLHATRARSGKGGGFGGTTGVPIPGTIEELKMPRLLLLATAHPTPTRLEPGRPVPPRFPTADAPVRVTSKRRELLAQWLRDPENPFVARAIVNRVHATLLGKPLVAPVDEVARPVDAAGATELDARARAFTAGGGRVSRLLTDVVLSRPYLDAATAVVCPVDNSAATGGGETSQVGMSPVTATIPLARFHLTEPEGSGCERYADAVVARPGARVLGVAQITAALSAATSHPTTAVTTAVRDVSAALDLWREPMAFPPRMLGASVALRDACLTAPALGTLAALPDDEARVTRLFHLTVGRAPDERERARARGMPLPELLHRLVTSGEFLAIP
jgi:hypothetical protein